MLHGAVRKNLRERIEADGSRSAIRFFECLRKFFLAILEGFLFLFGQRPVFDLILHFAPLRMLACGYSDHSSGGRNVIDIGFFRFWRSHLGLDRGDFRFLQCGLGRLLRCFGCLYIIADLAAAAISKNRAVRKLISAEPAHVFFKDNFGSAIAAEQTVRQKLFAALPAVCYF